MGQEIEQLEHIDLQGRLVLCEELRHFEDVELFARKYEESLARTVRRNEGIFYTPQDIVETIFGDAIDGSVDLSDKRFCDPCCGSGNFLIRALEVGFRPENIFGFDTDKQGVEIARARFIEAVEQLEQSDKAGFDIEKQIKVADFFKIASLKRYSGYFDYIMTNPPWGSKLTKKRRLDFSIQFESGRSNDSSAIMTCAALNTLSEGGVLALLLPDSFFNIGGFEDVRRRLLALHTTHLRDFGKPFPKLMTRAQSIIVRNVALAEEDVEASQIRCFYDGAEHKRSVGSFCRNPKAIINMWLNAAGAQVVDAIFAKEHITLHGSAKWALGIVTGNNDRYCSDVKKRGYVGVLRGKNLLPNNVITEASSFINSNLKRYQQVAPREIYDAPSKILYRFISSDLVFCHDDAGRYMLNSVNVLIPDDDFPIAHRDVAAMLSSPLMNWLFRAVWRTHKILRNDIERLPLHVGYFAESGNSEFDFKSYCKYLGIKMSRAGKFSLIK
ncbi:MAG: TaqI-like C-terminal specificity domain-containing protein [Rikenellaceae bacterium]